MQQSAEGSGRLRLPWGGVLSSDGVFLGAGAWESTRGVPCVWSHRAHPTMLPGSEIPPEMQLREGRPGTPSLTRWKRASGPER